MMEQRTLGREGLTVSAIGYGSMGTATAYGPADDKRSVSAIRTAYDLGVTHFDTAEMYGWGAGEELLGKALAPIRDGVTIATKFGLTPDGGTNSQPEHIRDVVDASLQRLDVDTIDLLYQHAHDPAVPVEDVIGVMKELVEAGKVRYLGMSNTEIDNVRRAVAVHPISAYQTEYSLFERSVESELGALEELGIGLVAYSPLARGFLTGAVTPRHEFTDDDFRRSSGWWLPGNFEQNVSTVEELSVLAGELGITLPQLSLAWLLAQRDYIVPIPGSTNPERVADNITAAGVRLDRGTLDRISAIVPEGAVGPRFV